MIINSLVQKVLFTVLSIGIISGGIIFYLAIGSQSKIVAWGDSLTLGTGGVETGGYVNILKNDGYNVLLKAYAGQTSTEIAIYQGAFEIDILKEKGKSNYTANPVFFGDFRKREKIVFSGSAGGSPVSLSRYRNGDWSVAGNISDWCKDKCKFRSSEIINESRTKNIIWVGRNNNLNFKDYVYRDISMIVKSLPLGSSFLVIGVTPALDDTEQTLKNIRELNKQLSDNYGKKFIDMWSVMADSDSDKIPKSLYSDHVHFNDKGYKIIASAIKKKL